MFISSAGGEHVYLIGIGKVGVCRQRAAAYTRARSRQSPVLIRELPNSESFHDRRSPAVPTSSGLAGRVLLSRQQFHRLLIFEHAVRNHC